MSADRQLLLMGRPCCRAIDVGELTAARLVPDPHLGRRVFRRFSHLRLRSCRVRCGVSRRRVVGREQRAPCFLIIDPLEIMIFADSARPRDGRPAVNGLKEALQIRTVRGDHQRLAHPRGAVEPTPGRHVGDRILIADDEIPALQVVVENLVMALRLPAVAIHRIVEALGRSELEMHGLTGKWTQTGSDEEQPGEELGPILRFADELAGLFGQIDQDRRRIENPRFLCHPVRRYRRSPAPCRSG